MQAANAAKRRAARCLSSGDGSSGKSNVYGIGTEDNEMKGEVYEETWQTSFVFTDAVRLRLKHV